MNDRIGAIRPYHRIYVAGHNGMVGSALVRSLRARGYANLITRARGELDLTDQAAVRRLFDETGPDLVFVAAARVGGILANSREPGEFLYQNLAIELNLIHEALRAGVKRLLFLGSSCIYPRDCPQPIREEYLLSGPLERSNEAYAVAKIAGLKLCEAFNAQHGTRYVSVMPTNLPALLRKAHEAARSGARALTVWGSGRPRRELLHVDDLAEACVLLMERDVGGGVYNVGTGTDVTVRELAETVTRVVGLDARLVFDPSKPDGTPCKRLDVSRIRALGWKHRYELEEGIRLTYEWCLQNGTFERAEAA
jgi:GDP-L-fucose synthase